MIRNRLLFIFGTRPEAIKLAPLILLAKEQPDIFEVKVCVTAQHREMLDQVLDFFEIKPDYDLNLMKENQNLSSLSAEILSALNPVFEDFSPDLVFVQGDTTTAFIGALSAFYHQCKVAHVEAGLRTYNKNEPFPEEINRQLCTKLADYHFAPTEAAKSNLLKEGVLESSIMVTGNTVIDALFMASKKVDISQNRFDLDDSKKMILVTLHRRENLGDKLEDICSALLELSNRDDVEIIFPVHLNPKVRKIVFGMLDGKPNIKLIDPASYPDFIYMMMKSYLIITDSGGIQEEAPSLNKPVLVTREVTERQEAVEAGTVLLVGTQKQNILDAALNLLDSPSEYQKMISRANPYGDGSASGVVLGRVVSYEL